MKKYEVWNAEAKGESGNVPVVLIDCNANAVVAVPLGTNADEERLPTHALVFVDGPSVIAIAYCEEAIVLDKGILTHRIGEVSEELDRSALIRAMTMRLAKAA